MKTIIFVVHSQEEGIKSVTQLVNDIKATEEANHKIFFTNLPGNVYYICKGEAEEDGKKHFTGSHEVIFVPLERLSIAISRFKDKEIVLEKNCMTLSGKGEKAKKNRTIIIDWLLEKMEEIEV